VATPPAQDQKIEPVKPVKLLAPEPDIAAPARKTPPEMAEEHKIASVATPPAQDQKIEPVKPVKLLAPEPDIAAPARKTPPEMAEEDKIASVIIPPAQEQKIKPVKPVKPQRPVSEVSNVYKVKKGDTLWDISEYYTGDPFNYPMIAADNEIKNPDFILPGQRILLKSARQGQR
jgi:nucleoid-associated protein YgaU